jgi:hypothetical protein
MSRDEERPRSIADVDVLRGTAGAFHTIYKPELQAIAQFDELIEKLSRQPGRNGGGNNGVASS